MTETLNGARLESLRHIHGLTQRDLGERLGMVQSQLSRIERGDLALPRAVAAKASELFAEPLSFFEVDTSQVPLGPVAFRRKSGTKAPERDRVTRLYAEAARVFYVVSEASGYRELDVLAQSASTPEGAAESVRAAVGLTPRQPVRNVTRLAERLGVGVVLDLDEEEYAQDRADASGISMPTAANRRPLIAAMSIGRGDVQRLTIGHELGHVLLHRNAATINCSSRSPQERDAYSFASSLLLPPAVVRARIDEYSTLREYLKLKGEYGLSASAIVMHARRLGIISDTRARTLQIQHSSRGWRDNEPVEVVPEEPALFRQALSKVYPTATYARASHDLGVTPHRLRRWVGERTSDGAGISNVTQLRRA